MIDILWIGSIRNKKWILGNWILENRKRIPLRSATVWLPLTFAKNHRVNSLFPKKLPKSRVYFFSYPTTFAWYSEQKDIASRSIVLYTHNEQPELGSDEFQVQLLNRAFAVHFFSSADAARLLKQGLNEEKIRVVNGAIDLDLPRGNIPWENREQLVIMASRFGYRKNPGLLTSVIRAIPEWNFLLLGRGWDDYLKENSLSKLSNLEYVIMNKESRNSQFPRGRVFLSTSTLEGGPIPLLESMYVDVSPVVSNTGFAQDVILENVSSHIFEQGATVDKIAEMISFCPPLTEANKRFLEKFSWDFIARQIFSDFLEIRAMSSE